MAKLPVLRAAVDGLAPSARRDALQEFLGYADSADLGEQQRTYVDVFDVSRKHALYLSYWTDGDTRRRGDGNGGHLYGTSLQPEEKDQLLEYLKTL